jgi:hypothetical protein
MEDPIVRLVVRLPSWPAGGNVAAFDTTRVPDIGDELSFCDGPIYEVKGRCWTPIGNNGERPWCVYLEVEEKGPEPSPQRFASTVEDLAQELSNSSVFSFHTVLTFLNRYPRRTLKTRRMLAEFAMRSAAERGADMLDMIVFHASDYGINRSERKAQ